MQKTPKKNLTMGIGFKLRSICKLVLVTILNYLIVPMNEIYFCFDRCNLVCLSCYITNEKIHKEHFGILYLLQYEKSIFSMSRFFCPLHSMVYFYFIVTTIWKKNLSNVTPGNSITMILLYLLQYYFLYFIVVSKRNKQLQVDTIANIELQLN